MKIQLKRSDKLDGGQAYPPSGSAMEYGELAVNYSSADPTIFIKDSGDNIIEIASKNATAQGMLWTSSGGNLYPTSINSKVGIGTRTPAAPLTIQDSTGAGIRLIGGSDATKYSSIISNGSGELNLSSPATGSITLNVGTTLGAHINSSGNVGIKKQDATVPLDVAGNGKFSGKVTSSATVDSDPSGTLTTKGYVETLAEGVVTDNAMWTKVDGAGGAPDKLHPKNINTNVGIGQQNPAEKLDVNGSVKISSRAYYTTGLTADEEDSGMYLTNKDYVDAGDHWATTNGKLHPQDLNAQVGIGTDSPRQNTMLDVNGGIAATNFCIHLLPVLGA